MRAGSITRAAAALRLSQPTVSQRIQRLERAAGERLLLREPRGTRITPAGETMLAYVERVLALHDEARAAIGRRGEVPHGRRVLGLLEDLALTTLPTALADFAGLHPRIDLEVIIGPAATLRPLADRGRVDLVFGDPSVMSGNAVRWRRSVPLLWVGADATFELTLPKTLGDGRFELARDLSDSEGQRIEDETGAGYAKITDAVVSQYDLGGDQSRGVLLLSGMYGRFKDTDLARQNMLKGAAEGDGATVVVGPRTFTRSGSPTVGCEVLRQRKPDTSVVYPVCAWADGNTAAVVAPIVADTAAQGPSAIDLGFYARFALQVRTEAVKAIE